ncbi:MFS transporter [Halobacteriales archaeon QS_1_67_19]|nr:MAG: MFS transporter [Halobacteriales archaeon QS_1_67_19]
MGTALAVYVGERGSPFAVSMVLTAYFLGLMVFSPVWGAIADVTGRRRTVLVATGATATLAVLPLLAADGVVAPIGARGLYAVFAAGFAPVMLTIVSAHGGESGRGRSLGFFNSTRAVGFAGGQLTVGALLGLLAPEQLYLVIAAVSLVSTLAVAFVSDPTPEPADGEPSREDGGPSLADLRAEIKDRLFPAAGERDHLTTNGLGWLYVALALRNMTVLGVMSLMPPYLTGQVGVSEFVMGALLAINPAGQVVFMLVFGRLADAVGRKPLIIAGMAGSGLFAVIAGVATAPDAHLARLLVAGTAFVVIAAAFSAMTTGALAFIGDVADEIRTATARRQDDAAPAERESELMGLRSTAKGVGGVLGPPAFGAVATVASYETAFLGGSVLAFCAAGLAGVRLVESRTSATRAVAADD